MAYKDYNVKYTGYKKYVEGLNRETAKMLKRKAKRIGRNLRCEGQLHYRGDHLERYARCT
jgi:hypothetical protein